MADMFAALPDRFWDKVMSEPNSGCWFWIGHCQSNGYGRFWNEKCVMAHRFSYEKIIGDVPDGLDLDHLCRMRCCVNPDHLEPVTRKENMSRSPISNGQKTHCPRGHKYDYTNSKGRRFCRACNNMNARRRYAMSKEKTE